MTDRSVIIGTVTMAQTALSRKQDHLIQQRSKILTTALELFSERGFAETPVREIAKRAGLAKGSLYLYFSSKKDLLEQVVKRYALLPELGDLVADVYELPFDEGFPRLVSRMWKLLRQRRRLARVLTREVFGHALRGAVFAKSVVRPANKVLADYFEAHIQRGELRRVKTGPAARCLFGMLWGFLLNQELMRTPRGETLSDEEVVRVICDIFTHGIVAR